MPEAPQIFRVTVQVTDITAAARFYSSLLGIEGRSIQGGRYYFDCGSVILALVDLGDGSARPNPDDIYFSVTDLEAAHARASRLGCLAQGLVHGVAAGDIVVRPWGERSFYVVDPYGNELCFVEASTVFTGQRAAAELRR
jgi:predicted enzyme related to lactoylglutathione lyase